MKARKILDSLDYEIYLSFDSLVEYKIPKSSIYKDYTSNKFYTDESRLIPVITEIENIAQYKNK